MHRIRHRSLLFGSVMALLILLTLLLSDFQQTSHDVVLPDGVEREKWSSPADTIPLSIRLQERVFAKTLPIYSRSGGARSNQTGNSDGPDFIFRGPNNFGGRTRALALDVTDEQIIFAGSVSGGLWRSENSGQSWTRVTSKNTSPSVSSIVQDKRQGKENRWYYGTGELIGGGGFRSPGDGIFRSDDGGRSWSLMESTSTGKFSYLEAPDFALVNELAVDASNETEEEVYAAVDSKIIRTIDGFETYEVVLGAENPISESFNTFDWSDVAILSDGTVIATLAGSGDEGALVKGVFISSDGLQWTDISFGSGLGGNSLRLEIALNPSNEDEFYVLSPSSIHHYTISTNTWENRFTLPAFYNTQNGYNMTVAVHPEQEDVIYVGGVTLFRSENGFTTKDYTLMHTFRDGIDLHPDIHNIVFYPSDASKMLVATDGGISITNDNLSNELVWKDLDDDYQTTQFNTVALNHLDITNQLAGGTQDNSSFYIDEEGPAVDALNIFGGDGYSAAINGDMLLVSSQKGGIGVYEIHEAGLEQLGSPGNDRTDFPFKTTFSLDPIRTDRMALGASDGVYLINDSRQIINVETWRKVLIPEMGSPVSAMDFSFEQENMLIVGAANGQLFKISNLEFPSPSIEEITIGTVPGVAPFYNNTASISIDPQNSNEIVVTNDLYGLQSIYYTSDGGQSWTPVGGNLEEFSDGSGNGPSVQWVEILPDGPENRIYLAATSVGLYITHELSGMNTVWERLAPEVIGLTPVDMIDVRYLDGTIAIASYGNGLFQGRLDVPLFATISYSIPQDPAEQIVLKGNRSNDPEYQFEYQWLLDGEEIFSATSAEHQANRGGTYTLRLTNIVSGEVSISNPVFLAPSIITSIEDFSNDAPEIKVFPNPSSGRFEIELSENYAEGFEFSIVDANGNQILIGTQEQSFTDSKLGIDLTHVPDGTYLLNLTNEKVRKTVKLLKQGG